MSTRVKISANIISWPQVCACCLGRPDTTYDAGYTRRTGKRVVRTQTKKWEVPYCDTCLEHVEADRIARSIQSWTPVLVLVLGYLFGLSGLFYGFFCCCGSVLPQMPPSQATGSGASKTPPTNPQRGGESRPSDRRNPQGQQEAVNLSPAARVLFAGSGVVGMVLGAGTILGGHYLFRRLQADVHDRRRKARQRADNLARPTCPSLEIAVTYGGWYGSVHTFWFVNSDYANRFVTANRGKIIR